MRWMNGIGATVALMCVLACSVPLAAQAQTGYEYSDDSYNNYDDMDHVPMESNGGGSMNAMVGAGAGVAAAMMIGILYFLILVFLIIYVLGHVKGKKEGKEDVFLGSKVMLTLFMSLCFQVVLAGIATILMLASMKHTPKGAVDVPLGLLLGGLIAGVYPTVVFFAGIRGRGAARVGRKALGINAIVAGIFSTVGIIAIFVLALLDQRVLEILMFTVVYFLAFVGCASPLVASASKAYIAQEEAEAESTA
jgi:hypothetical protein